MDPAERQNRKTELDRIEAMLSRLGGRGYPMREGSVSCGAGKAEIDPDPDSDLDGTAPMLGARGVPHVLLTLTGSQKLRTYVRLPGFSGLAIPQ